MTTTSVGKQLSGQSPKESDIGAWADAIADMLSAYLTRLGGARGRVSPERACHPDAQRWVATT